MGNWIATNISVCVDASGQPYGIGLHRDTPWCMFVVDVEAVVPMAAELDGAYNTVAYGRLMHFPPITLALIR